ncbi:MAG: hypothetical protein P4K80_08090 [Acidobacteriaceae bacterium]|nr:hypothetical protein [Acidobacteriaceae bacterium]
MLGEMQMKVAFATSNRERVDGGFEQAKKIVVYEVGVSCARSVSTYTFGSSRKRTTKCEQQEHDNSSSTKYKIRRRCPDRCNEEEIARRIATLGGVSVLVIHKDLQAHSVLALKHANIYPIKVDDPEFIGVVIAQLQELMKSDAPLWLRRNIARADQESV